MTSSELIARIARAYGIEPRAVAERQSGYRNHSYRITPVRGEPVNLIVYKREPGILERIRRANAISDALAALGLPTRRTLGPITKLHNDHYLRYTCLYTYLPGATIPWEAYTQDHLKLLGATMGHLHTALRHLPHPDLPPVTTEYAAIVRRMSLYFAGPEVQAALTTKLELHINSDLFARYEKLLRICENLPQQPLHMDLVRSNVLFAESNPPKLTGILDFEKAALGHPAFDLARTLAFLLVDCKYKTETQVRKYFLYSGYHKRGGRPLPRIQLVDALCNLFLIYDFYKFLRHNPYEFLPENEHFVRTRALLISRGLLQSVVPVAPVRAKPVL